MTTVWLVAEPNGDDEYGHCAFVDEADATWYAKLVRGSLREIPLYAVGAAPTLHTVWHASGSLNSCLGAHSEMWSELTHPEPPPTCSPVKVEHYSYDVELSAFGTDKDAVKRAVRERATAVRDALAGS